MKITLARLLAVALLLPIVACKKKETPPEPETPAPAKPAAKDAAGFTPARQTSFGEVTSQLDTGGDLFVYLATDQWLAGLSTNVSRFRDALLDMAEVEPDKRKTIDRGLQLITDAVKGSGVESLSGVGISGAQVTAELHRTKLILHHRRGEGGGLLWNVMGKRPHALSGMDLLTTNAVFAVFGDMDIRAIWNAIESSLSASGIPDAVEGLKRWPNLFEQRTKMSWQKLLTSYGGELGVVLTLDDAASLDVPLGEKTLSTPEPGLLIAVKVNDGLLYNRISSELKNNPQVKMVEEQGLKMCVMAVPVPVPMELQITVASCEGYLLLASSPTLVRDALAVRDGKSAGLRKAGAFEALMKHLPAEGNQFVYVDRRLSTTIQELQRQVLNSENLKQGQLRFAEKFLLKQKPVFGLSIGSHTDTGWQSVSVGNRNASTAFLAAPAVPAVAVATAMVLPALSKAKEKAQSISCINNMKQQGLAFRMWSLDNGDKYPFNVSTSKGGTLELCDRDSDGFDRNSFKHFQVMSNELSTPKILVCPQDKGKHAALDFQDLQPDNVSYQVHSGVNVSESNPNEVLTYCPLHHHRLYADGSVKQEAKDRPSGF